MSRPQASIHANLEMRIYGRLINIVCSAETSKLRSKLFQVLPSEYHLQRRGFRVKLKQKLNNLQQPQVSSRILRVCGTGMFDRGAASLPRSSCLLFSRESPVHAACPLTFTPINQLVHQTQGILLNSHYPCSQCQSSTQRTREISESPTGRCHSIPVRCLMPRKIMAQRRRKYRANCDVLLSGR